MASRSSMVLESSRKSPKYILCGEQIVLPAGPNPSRQGASSHRKVLGHGDVPCPAQRVFNRSSVNQAHRHCQVER